MDLDAIAMCWVESEPFRQRRLVSIDPSTQKAIEALLSGGYQRMVEAIGHRDAASVIDRAAYHWPLTPKTLPQPEPPPPLAPLEPDAFLRWCWERLPEAIRDPKPLRLEDIRWESRVRDEDWPEFRRRFVKMAAAVRRNQRIRIDPWFGIPMEWRP